MMKSSLAFFMLGVVAGFVASPLNPSLTPLLGNFYCDGRVDSSKDYVSPEANESQSAVTLVIKSR